MKRFGSTIILGFFAFTKSKLNMKIFNFVYRDFQRHPDTNDFKTSKDVGGGYGYAKSTDTLFLGLLFLRYSLASVFFKDRGLIDLGCGDGAVLRLAEFIGFKTVIGVEISESLAGFAKINSKNSSILIGSYANLPTMYGFDSFKIKTVFVFNPGPVFEIQQALCAIATNQPKILIYRNPKWALELENRNFDLKLLKSFKNYKIFTFNLKECNFR